MKYLISETMVTCLLLFLGSSIRTEAFQQARIPSGSASRITVYPERPYRRPLPSQRIRPSLPTLYAVIPLIDDATIDPLVTVATAATTSMALALEETASTEPSNTEEVLKTVAIALTLGGGLIPATISANQQMIQALSGRKGYNNGEPVPEDDPSNTFDPTAGKGINPLLRQYVIDSGASGPSLPQQQLLFAADNIPLVDIIAVLGRIPDTDSIVDWRSLPSATRSGTTSTSNPPMWLPRNAFKVLIRQAKFVAWPNDPKTGEPIGDAALDAVFDSWAWGASIATPDKVENTLKLFKPSPNELDLDAFVGAAIRGRSQTAIAAATFIVIQNQQDQKPKDKMPSQKTFRTKRTLAKKQRQNRPLPHWIRLRTDNSIKWNAKRRHWRRTKLGL
ncbi:ribosomal L39 protein [Nitzschia inconspicua]|uniref:Ribosomal L39 protein n=1 Tax=Nitzschia inconspicua TaxID=303405 RepID=A0A9K3PMT2_9STRA|nr:ribosomal L39 protein [Nitzschia inconspicua]